MGEAGSGEIGCGEGADDVSSSRLLRGKQLQHALEERIHRVVLLRLKLPVQAVSGGLDRPPSPLELSQSPSTQNDERRLVTGHITGLDASDEVAQRNAVTSATHDRGETNTAASRSE